MTFNFEEFKKIILKLEKNRVDYFIFGGFAFDAINRESNKHDDLDIIFFLKDKENIINLFKKIGYKTYKLGRKNDYRRNDKKIDILFIEDKGDYYEILGNISRDKLSKDVFLKKNKVQINGFNFVIMPYEWFSLYKDKHYVEEKRKKLNETIEKILPLCNPLKILEQEDVNKPKNMDLIEI